MNKYAELYSLIDSIIDVIKTKPEISRDELINMIENNYINESAYLVLCITDYYLNINLSSIIREPMF